MNKIPLFKVFMSKNAPSKVSDVLMSGYIGQGEKVEEFEKNLAHHFKNDKILTLNSGTSGLHLAIHLLKKPQSKESWPGLNYGDEVLATPLTCTASNWPILANGLNIKWVDINPLNLNLCLDDLERKISKKTKLIMLVHWGGYPNDLDKINEIVEKKERELNIKVKIIEDGAHSFGSKYKGNFIGNHGNFTMFSLQAIKHITSIDGGLLVCPDKYQYERGKLIRWYGIDRDGERKDFRCEEDILEWGFKFHMNDVCATVGIENLNHYSEIVTKHIDNANFYDKNLKNSDRVTLLQREQGFESAFWIYSLLVEDRDEFYKYMDSCGITVSQVHARNDKHTCVKEFSSDLPKLEKTIDKVVSIPVGWWVSNDEREYIVECINKW